MEQGDMKINWPHLPGLPNVLWLWLGLLLGGCQAPYTDVRFAPSLTADWQRHTLPTQQQEDGILLSGRATVNNAAGRRIQVDVFGYSELWGRTHLGTFELEATSNSHEIQRFELFVAKSTLGQLNLLGPWQVELEAKDLAQPGKYIGGDDYAFEPFSGYQVGQMMIMVQPVGTPSSKLTSAEISSRGIARELQPPMSANRRRQANFIAADHRGKGRFVYSTLAIYG
jgi:hypothetical protein